MSRYLRGGETKGGLRLPERYQPTLDVRHLKMYVDANG